jgi:hypothetical protein
MRKLELEVADSNDRDLVIIMMIAVIFEAKSEQNLSVYFAKIEIY